VLLEGELGAGKTTFVKEVCAQLGVQELVNSPTYAIVNHYLFEQNKTIYHFDLYRLEYEELFDLGFEEYLVNGDLIFIEWPEVAAEFYPTETVVLKISKEDSNRKYVLSPFNKNLT